jgi:hypothetical protein
MAFRRKAIAFCLERAGERRRAERFTTKTQRTRRKNQKQLCVLCAFVVNSRVVSALFVSIIIAFSAAPARALQSPGNAQDQAPSAATQSADTPPPSRWQWSFSVRNRTGLRLHRPRVLQMSRTFLDAKGRYKLSDNWRLTLEGRLHYDPVERLGYPKKPWLDPQQVLFDGQIKRVRLSLGLQQTVWGQADGLRVLDVINPLDYREFILEDFLDSRRPLWTARADIPVEKGWLQLVWVPYFAPGRLPGPDNEFGLGPSFGLGLITAAGDPSLPQLPIRVEPTARPPYRFRSGQAGARFSRSVGKWDLTANYFYGWEDVPTPYLRAPASPAGAASSALTTAQIAPALSFAPRYDRKEIFGGTAATNFGPVVLRLEAGWNTRKASAVTISPPRSGFAKFGQFSSVVGADYSPREWLWLSGQYFLQFTSAPQRALLLPRYNHLASVYLRANFFRDTLRPELFILTGLNQRQHMIRPRVVRRFGDHWSVGLGADFLGGRPITPFGFFQSRDRAVLEIKWMK